MQAHGEFTSPRLGGVPSRPPPDDDAADVIVGVEGAVALASPAASPAAAQAMYEARLAMAGDAAAPLPLAACGSHTSIGAVAPLPLGADAAAAAPSPVVYGRRA